MPQQFNKINNPPNEALLVWDGECKFCGYWVTRLKNTTGDAINYAPFQKAAIQFPEVPEKEFRNAVKLIDPSGNIYSGAAAILKTLDYGTSCSFVFSFYKKYNFFKTTSDFIYKKISSNRPLAYKATLALWGKNPSSPKPYWLLYIVAFIVAIKLAEKK